MLHGFRAPCEIWGKGCKLLLVLLGRLASILRHFQAFELQNSAVPGNSTPDPLELLIAITKCTAI